MKIESNMFNVNSSKGPSHQLFKTGKIILFDVLETCSSIFLIIFYIFIEDGENQLEGVYVAGKEGKK